MSEHVEVLEAEVARLRAEVERLTRDREDYREKRANEVENLRRERDALAARLGEAEGLLRSLTAGRMVCLSCWQDTDHHSPDCRLATFLTAGARDGGTR